MLVAGQGPIGLMFTRLLALRGVKVIASDLMRPRLALARRWGARWAFRADDRRFPEQVMRLTKNRGVDAAVLAVSADAALFQAQELVRGGGQVLLFAHTQRGVRTGLDLSAVCMDEKDLIGSYSADFMLQKQVANVVFSRKLDVRQLVTHQFPLEKTAAAVELAAKPTPKSLKVMVMR